MPYAASATAGTQLQINDTTYKLIEGVQSISGPTAAKTTIETTALSDTAKKFVAGMPDYGEMTVELAWDPADAVHQVLQTKFATANATADFKIICPDAGAAEIAFTGASVVGFPFAFEKDSFLKRTVTIKLSGNVTITP